MSDVCVQQNYSAHMNSCERTILNSKSNDKPARKNLVKEDALGLVGTLQVWQARAHQRKQLALLSQDLLDDIGLTNEMVKQEVSKPFWKK